MSLDRKRIRNGHLGTIGVLLASSFLGASACANAGSASNAVAVGPQYDTTHVYINSPRNYDAFIRSFTHTFGGKASGRISANVTPVKSETQFQYVWSPAGTLSTFSFKTPIPYPFGMERYGYLVTDIDEALQKARQCGAGVVVAKFRDPIGEDAVIEWPGGLAMQLYWHFKTPHYSRLENVPVNRVYVSKDAANTFVRDFLCFSDGRIVSDEHNAHGASIGRPGYRFRRVRIESGFGRMEVFVTDGHLPYPFGHEVTGYGVRNVGAALARAKATGATVLWGPYRSGKIEKAVVRFPGGYIAQIHGG